MLNDTQSNYAIKRCKVCNHFFDTDYMHDDCGLCLGCCQCAKDDAIPNDSSREFSAEQLAIIARIQSEGE